MSHAIVVMHLGKIVEFGEAMDRCRREAPALAPVDERLVACHLFTH